MGYLFKTPAPQNQVKSSVPVTVKSSRPVRAPGKSREKSRESNLDQSVQNLHLPKGGSPTMRMAGINLKTNGTVGGDKGMSRPKTTSGSLVGSKVSLKNGQIVQISPPNTLSATHLQSAKVVPNELLNSTFISKSGSQSSVSQVSSQNHPNSTELPDPEKEDTDSYTNFEMREIPEAMASTPMKSTVLPNAALSRKPKIGEKFLQEKIAFNLSVRFFFYSSNNFNKFVFVLVKKL